MKSTLRWEDGMVTIKRYTNLTEADEDKALLAAAGIPAFLAGENCASAGYGSVIGELRLQIAEADLERARRILSEHEGFAPLPDDFVPPEEPPAQIPRENPGAINNIVVCLLVVSVVINILFLLRFRDRRSYTGTTRYEYNHDGHTDAWYHYEKGKLVSAEQDRNFNGFPDAWWHYEDGIVACGEFDENFDGKPEAYWRFRNGVVDFCDTDTDFNGVPDVHSTYVNGVIAEDVWFAKNGSVFRRESYQHGRRYQELIDEDGDGWFDKRITYDSLNRATRTEQIHEPVPPPRK